MLYLCATPIGNLKDITKRVVEVLQSVDYIACEDTRHTLKLLNHLEIKKTLISYHEHNKKFKGDEIVSLLKNGKEIALVSDAGMPAISDPGMELVELCYKENINVTVCPGASAVVTAIALSGLNSRRFIFEGFLPKDKIERNYVLSDLKTTFRTTVFYEAPHRLKETLTSFRGIVSNDRKVCCLREITKKYEQVVFGDIDFLIEYFNENQPKGEFVIVIEGFAIKKLEEVSKNAFMEKDIVVHMDEYLEEGLSVKDAMKKVAKDRGISKRDVYSDLLLHKHDSL